MHARDVTNVELFGAYLLRTGMTGEGDEADTSGDGVHRQLGHVVYIIVGIEVVEGPDSHELRKV